MGGGGGGGRYGGSRHSPVLPVCCEVFLEPKPLELDLLSGDVSFSSGALLAYLTCRGGSLPILLSLWAEWRGLRTLWFSSWIARKDGSSWLYCSWTLRSVRSAELIGGTELRSLKYTGDWNVEEGEEALKAGVWGAASAGEVGVSSSDCKLRSLGHRTSGLRHEARFLK